MDERARILVLTGSGKGKTTAALGMVVRAAAYGRKVLLVRFAKARHSGELDLFAGMANVTVLSDACGMTPPASHPDFPRHAAEAMRLFAETRSLADSYDMIVLDEICGMVARAMVPETLLLSLLKGLRPDQTAVLTGRGAGVALMAVADTVSEVLALKHGFDRGIPAREGVEY